MAATNFDYWWQSNFGGSICDCVRSSANRRDSRRADDNHCETLDLKLMGGVSLLCRITVLGKVAQESTILAHLPYSEALYEFSTGGKKFSR